jgi:hypothetical protein
MQLTSVLTLDKKKGQEKCARMIAHFMCATHVRMHTRSQAESPKSYFLASNRTSGRSSARRAHTINTPFQLGHFTGLVVFRVGSFGVCMCVFARRGKVSQLSLEVGTMLAGICSVLWPGIVSCKPHSTLLFAPVLELCSIACQTGLPFYETCTEFAAHG